ncbi:MAG: right-handed parallel beta-helix repeat-containing protein, partial [Planctomycetota bacterium]
MSWYRSFLIVAVVGLFVSAAQATTIYVDDDNCPGPGSGTEGDPYCSIQTAIDTAVDTDEIVVAPGTYNETIDFLGRAVWLHSSDGAGVTIIDAQETGTVVTCESGEGPETVLEGFTITGGEASFATGGGGMFIRSSSPSVVRCAFVGNQAVGIDGHGGGMYVESGNPLVEDCVFIENHAHGIWVGDGRGGGMYTVDSSPTVTHCVFAENWTGSACAEEPCPGSGGGMYNDHSSPTVTDCTFSGNGAKSGGGMYNNDSSPTVVNCSFVSHHVEWQGSYGSGGAGGGGMLNGSSSSPTVTNCTFSGNSARSGGGMVNWNSSPTVTDCTFDGNHASNIGGGMFNADSGSSPTVTDCTFSGNSAGAYSGGNGGGMYN